MKFFENPCHKILPWRHGYDRKGSEVGTINSKYDSPAGRPDFPVDFMKDFENLSAVELAEAMEQALETMTEETYDEALLRAFLDELDRKAPPPRLPDAQAGYARFQKALQASAQRQGQARRGPVRLRRLARAGLAAAIAAVCLLGSIVAVQAAGVDVLGAMARWSDGVFAFGTLRTSGAVDEPAADAGQETESAPTATPNPEWGPVGEISAESLSYDNLQQALDSFAITEVTAPDIPEGYVLDGMEVMDLWEDGIFDLSATYTSEDMGVMHIIFDLYTDQPAMMVIKSDADPEVFQIEDVTFYLIENSRNYTLAWLTEHYECYISAADPELLREMAQSMFD